VGRIATSARRHLGLPNDWRRKGFRWFLLIGVVDLTAGAALMWFLTR